MNHDSKGFWCEHCNYGGAGIKRITKCPMCGGEQILTQQPFPVGKPKGMGSGKPNGKTARKRADIKGGPPASRAAKAATAPATPVVKPAKDEVPT